MSYRVIKHAAVDANSGMTGTRDSKKRFKSRLASYAKGVQGKLSKYVGGFIKGKNSPAYNHDYYIKNKERWRINRLRRLARYGDKKAIEELAAMDIRNAEYLDPLREEKNYRLRESSQLAEQRRIRARIQQRAEALEETKSAIKLAGEHKYLYRIKKENGRYRYFYSQSELSRYMLNVKQIEGPHDPFYDMNQVNPNYYTGEREYTHNCAWCTTAYDLRRRGYDVQAVASRSGNYNDDQESLYVNKDGKHPTFSGGVAIQDAEKKGATEVREELAHNLYNSINEYPDGARGYVSMSWSNDRGGHSMAFEKHNGTVYLLDTQTHKTYTEEQFVNQVAPSLSTKYWIEDENGHLDEKNGNPTFYSLRHLRVDDCELSDQFQKFEYASPDALWERDGGEKDVDGKTPFIPNGTRTPTDDEKKASEDESSLITKNYVIPGGISGIEAFERTQNRRTGGRK